MRGFLKRIFCGGCKDEKKRRDGWTFIFNTFAFSLIVMAVLISVEPYLDYDNPDLADIVAVERSLQFHEASDIPQLIARTYETEQKPVMLVLYASWCSVCKKMMPGLVGMKEEGAFDKVAPLFVAMPDQPRILSKYLFYSNYYNSYELHAMQSTMLNRIKPVLQGLGSEYVGAIPYVGFYGKDAKVIAEFSGLMDKQAVLDLMEKAAGAGSRADQ